MALKWPIMCRCAVKKLLTHSLTHSPLAQRWNVCVGTEAASGGRVASVKIRGMPTERPVTGKADAASLPVDLTSSPNANELGEIKVKYASYIQR